MCRMATTGRTRRHFVVYRDRSTLAWSVEEFSDDEKESAFTRMADLENHHGDQHSIEVVLLGAESLATIRYTHGDLFVGEECVPPLVPAPNRA